MNVKEAMEIMSEALYHTNNPVSAEAIKISLEALERQILKNLYTIGMSVLIVEKKSTWKQYIITVGIVGNV